MLACGPCGQLTPEGQILSALIRYLDVLPQVKVIQPAAMLVTDGVEAVQVSRLHELHGVKMLKLALHMFAESHRCWAFEGKLLKERQFELCDQTRERDLEGPHLGLEWFAL